MDAELARLKLQLNAAVKKNIMPELTTLAHIIGHSRASS